MIIVPTRICNTDKCSYCWVLKKDFENKYFKNLNINDFKEKIKLLSRKTWDYNLRFFWWEPFLKFPTIKEIIKILNKEKYNFTINTNLSLIKEEYIPFLKENNIKLIISCNWDLYSHCLTRNLEKDKTIILYENIKKIVKYWIDYQINIVTTPKIVDRLHKNFNFIYNKLWWKIFNLLPVNYNWWTNKWLEIFKEQLELIEKDIKLNKLKINFINKEISNEVSLFNSEIVIDSDWKVYPSMVILETFFEKEKEKIQITDFNKNITEITSDLKYYEKDNHKIYDNFINKVLNKKFEDIIENDNRSSEIFSDFLKKI